MRSRSAHALTVDGLTELRLSVPEAGRRLLPLPVAVWHKDVGKRRPELPLWARELSGKRPGSAQPAVDV